MISLMAHVFEVWTLLHSKYFFENLHLHKNSNKSNPFDPNGCIDKNYLKRSRIPQVVAVMRLFSMDNKQKQFISNLVQIGTGAGKSLILAVTATILALPGFEVYCTCYGHGQLLTKRDYKSFEKLFRALNIHNSIEYGAYVDLVWKLYDNSFDGNRYALDALIAETSNYVLNQNLNNYAHKQMKKRYKIDSRYADNSKSILLSNTTYFGMVIENYLHAIMNMNKVILQIFY